LGWLLPELVCLLSLLWWQIWLVEKKMGVVCVAGGYSPDGSHSLYFGLNCTVGSSCPACPYTPQQGSFEKLDVAIVIPPVAIGFFLPTGFLATFTGHYSLANVDSFSTLLVRVCWKALPNKHTLESEKFSCPYLDQEASSFSRILAHLVC